MQQDSMIKYIGVDDTDIRLFENQYPVPEGMAYNSYLIDDEKCAILDTVDIRKADLWLQNLEKALCGRTPDYLVVHHLEPDHSALIGKLLEKYKNLQVVATQKALQMLPQFFENVDIEGRAVAVKDGDTLSLGKHTLRFLTAPMVHWPEVMVSFEEQTGILFSADAFGKFGALSVPTDEDWACEARRYFFNICGKYGAPVQTLLRKVAGLKVNAIYPLHGPQLTNDLPYYIRLYDIWSKYEAEREGMFVGYASIHGGTKIVAEYVAKLLQDKGVDVCLMDLTETEVSFAVEDAFAYGKAILLAASYDAGLFPPMHNLLHHLQQKAWQNKTVALVENGSWAPSAGRVMKQMLETMKDIRLVEPVVTIRSRMKEQDKAQLETLVNQIINS
ncbi:MAG: FprA family A-type flavoprotein [Paludibacteraceae bacterium]|nr:FprA family A-type flavoprotein [Paludibacteraceae bacterium]